jgi:hypothetical protein
VPTNPHCALGGGACWSARRWWTRAQGPQRTRRCRKQATVVGKHVAAPGVFVDVRTACCALQRRLPAPRPRPAVMAQEGTALEQVRLPRACNTTPDRSDCCRPRAWAASAAQGLPRRPRQEQAAWQRCPSAAQKCRRLGARAPVLDCTYTRSAAELPCCFVRGRLTPSGVAICAVPHPCEWGARAGCRSAHPAGHLQSAPFSLWRAHRPRKYRSP